MASMTALLSSFMLGLLGSAHCVAMCGGIVGALSVGISAKSQDFSGEKKKLRALLYITLYNVGRISSYCIVALLLFFLTRSLSEMVGVAGHSVSAFSLRLLSGLMLIAMGLYLGQWWYGLLYLEKLGQKLWRYLQPFSRHLLPVDNLSKAFRLGFLWGWLPCGLVYSAIVYSQTQPNLLLALLTMLAFGLGTLPTLMLTGLLADRIKALVTQKKLRSLMALMLIIMGVWTIYGGYHYTLGKHGSMMNHSHTTHH